MRIHGEVYFNVLLLVVFGAALIGAASFPPAAQSFPYFVTVPGLALSLWLTIQNLLKSRAGAPDNKVPPEQMRRVYIMVASFAGMVALIVLVGMPIGIALFGFGFTYLNSKRGIWVSAGVMVFGFLLVWGLFGQVLHFMLYGGVFGILGI